MPENLLRNGNFEETNCSCFSLVVCTACLAGSALLIHFWEPTMHWSILMVGLLGACLMAAGAFQMQFGEDDE